MLTVGSLSSSAIRFGYYRPETVKRRQREGALPESVKTIVETLDHLHEQGLLKYYDLFSEAGMASSGMVTGMRQYLTDPEPIDKARAAIEVAFNKVTSRKDLQLLDQALSIASFPAPEEIAKAIEQKAKTLKIPRHTLRP